MSPAVVRAHTILHLIQQYLPEGWLEDTIQHAQDAKARQPAPGLGHTLHGGLATLLAPITGAPKAPTEPGRTILGGRN